MVVVVVLVFLLLDIAVFCWRCLCSLGPVSGM
jgi:hypothetical protein